MQPKNSTRKVDPELHEGVTKKIIHSPCGALNLYSPC